MNFIIIVPSSTRIQCRPLRSSGSGIRSLSHARSAPPALKMMGITAAGEWSFTFSAARVSAPKRTLSASTTHYRYVVVRSRASLSSRQGFGGGAVFYNDKMLMLMLMSQCL